MTQSTVSRVSRESRMTEPRGAELTRSCVPEGWRQSHPKRHHYHRRREYASAGPSFLSGVSSPDPRTLPASIVASQREYVGDVHYRHCAGSFLRVCFRKVRSDARPNQQITFARCRRQALPIKYRDLPAAAPNQTATFQLAGSIRSAWPLRTQHFGEQALSDLQSVIVTAVTHRE
jgi:hypothetical protein